MKTSKKEEGQSKKEDDSVREGKKGGRTKIVHTCSYMCTSAHTVYIYMYMYMYIYMCMYITA